MDESGNDGIESDDTVTGQSSSAPCATATAPEPGSAFGRYQIVGVLGEGGMGVVLEAHDPDLDRRVAIKLLHAPDRDATRAGGVRLLREARAMARLSHPNVITVFEVGTIDGADFVAMEFIDGASLDVWLSRGGRTWQEVLGAFVSAGRGLIAAHDAGLIHRDFKPANVLVARDGRVLVTDFGLARRVEEPAETPTRAGVSSDATKLTATGAVLGTPAYMAPEQHRGETADERTDQFNFCVALYEGLYGTRPFAGGSLGELRVAVVSGRAAEPPVESAVPPSVRRAVMRGLALHPRDRHRSLRSLLDTLTGGLERGRRRAVAAVVAGAVIVSSAVATYVAWPQPSQSSAECEQPAALFDDAWSPARAAAVGAVFEAGDGAAIYAGFAASLDTYRRDWIGAYEGTCSGRGAAGDEVFHRDIACLLGYRAHVRVFVDEFVQADAAMVEQALAATAELPDPAGCLGEGGSRSPPPVPDDPQLRAQVRSYRTELATVLALQRSLRGDEVLARVSEVLDRVRELGYEPLIAEVLRRRGNVLLSLGRYADAKSELREAVLVAEEAGYVEVHARALVNLLEVFATYSSDELEGAVLARRASAATRRCEGHGTSPWRAWRVRGATTAKRCRSSPPPS